MNELWHQASELSFEFFPPRSPDAEARLAASRRVLAAFKPRFFSVTFGAGGSTRELTLETALATSVETGVSCAPHISCIGSSLREIRTVLEKYMHCGVRRLVALRGDLPSGSRGGGELSFGNELVEFIRSETGNHFHIDVAAYPEVHPQSPNADADLEGFKRKVEAGADGAITQYFYNADAYFYFVERCHKVGIDIPIVPGVMPIVNYRNLKRFSDMCGAEIPRWIQKRLSDYGDNLSSASAFGVEVVTDLCDRLLRGGAPGLHFYTMNRSDASHAICSNLKLIGETSD